MGTRHGSIIASIITNHMPRNEAAAANHVCPGMRIHAMDIVQPPGIAIPPIADMELHQMIVITQLAAKRRPHTARNIRSECRSSFQSAEELDSGVCDTSATRLT